MVSTKRHCQITYIEEMFSGAFAYLLHPTLSCTLIVSVFKEPEAKYRIVVFPAASRPTITMRISKVQLEFELDMACLTFLEEPKFLEEFCETVAHSRFSATGLCR